MCGSPSDCEMKSVLQMLFLLSLAVLFCGCNASAQREGEDTPFLTESHRFAREYIDLGRQYTDWAVWGDTVYLLYEDGLDCFSDTAGTVRETAIAGGCAIDVYDREVFVIAHDSITVYDEQENVCESYLPAGENIGGEMYIGASADWIVYAYRAASAQLAEHRIFAQKRGDAAGVTELTEQIKGSYPICMLTGLQFTETDCVSMMLVCNPADTEQLLYAEYSFASNDIWTQYTIPHTAGYSVYDGELYCLTNRMDYPQLNRYDLLTGEKTALKTFSADAIMKGAGRAADNPRFSLHITGQQIFLADLRHQLLYLCPRNSAGKTLRVIIPDTGYSGMNFNDTFEEVISRFSAESGMDVECLALSRAHYEEKITAKLLAGDEDFDLFILPNTVQSQLYGSIAEKHASMPLEQYDSLMTALDSLYDGFSASVMHDGHIFSLPMLVSYSSLRINRDLFLEYGLPVPEADWTLDDVWALCDTILAQQLPIRVFCNGQAQIFSLIADCMEDSGFDREALTSLFEAVRRYGEAGVLYYDNDPPGAERLSWNEELDALFFMTYGLPTAPNRDNLHADTENLIPYPRVNGEAPHYIRAFDRILMNANTPQAEAAAQFLTVMYASETAALEDLRRDALNPYEAEIMKNGKLYVRYSDALFAGTGELYHELLYGDTDAADLAAQFYETVQYRING